MNLTVSNIDNNYYYTTPAITANSNNTQAQKTSFKDGFNAWINDEDKICTDGLDDGKISGKEKAESFGKGLAGIVKSTVKHPVITGLAIAGGVALTVATGGAAAPVLVAAGATIGAGTIGYGAYKAANAETDGEAKAAWETMGNGTFSVAASAAAAKPALNAASNGGVTGTQGLASNNPVTNTVNCFKVAPEAALQSGANIKGNFLTLTTGNIHANSNALRNGQVKYMSKANEAQSYRFNPNGTDEEILANNPGVFKGQDGKFYVNNKWDAEHPFAIDTSKEQMIMIYDKDDMAVCAADVFEGSYVDTAAFKANGALDYQKPSQLEYGKVIDVTKQAAGAFKEAPAGTKVQTIEGLAEVQEGQVIAIDHAGNPYVTPISNIIKRNVPQVGFEEAFSALQNK